jgi:hypothetical protein
MGVEQPSKIGKIGFLVAYTGVFIGLLTIVGVASHSLDIWDVASLIGAILLIIAGSRMIQRDVYMKRRGWKLLLWNFPQIRDRAALGLITGGNFYIIVTILFSRMRGMMYATWPYSWIPTSLAVIGLIIGWGLVLTEREDNTTNT